MTKVIYVLFILFAAFAVSHYSLSQVWRNVKGVLIAAAVFALLAAIFLGALLS